MFGKIRWRETEQKQKAQIQAWIQEANMNKGALENNRIKWNG